MKQEQWTQSTDLQIQLFAFLLAEYLNIDVCAFCAILVYRLQPKKWIESETRAQKENRTTRDLFLFRFVFVVEKHYTEREENRKRKGLVEIVNDITRDSHFSIFPFICCLFFRLYHWNITILFGLKPAWIHFVAL